MEQQEIKQIPNSGAEQEPEAKVWYAIRVTFNREMKVKDDLDLRGIESFVPMKYVMGTRRGRRVKKLVPTIHNLIFFHIEPSLMKEYKATTKLPIRYIMNPATKKPVVVPEQEMKNFIAVAGTYEEQLVYITPKPGQFSRGDRVRILGGPFEGAEGVLQRVKGDSRVIVSIKGLVAVATTAIHPSLLEKIPKTK
ncbi:MAG: UpxY family transcription antiterminator [Muribaculaceae bacterium]|nr:UpxY family transcription antiterminator [Muribaculaceae bacterium]MBR6490692.1 UpxY family transcription antiterminator [Muribaculaceae bacterium]